MPRLKRGMTASEQPHTALRGSYANIQSIPFAAIGSISLSMRSRIQAPVGENSRLLLPLRRASATIFSARGRRWASKVLERRAEFLIELHLPAEPQRVLQKQQPVGFQ